MKANIYLILFAKIIAFQDIQVRVTEDFGIESGFKNNIAWFRRQLRVHEGSRSYSLTLWNDIVSFLCSRKLFKFSFIGMFYEQNNGRFTR